jgi:hypothetical protein
MTFQIKLIENLSYFWIDKADRTFFLTHLEGKVFKLIDVDRARNKFDARVSVEP